MVYRNILLILMTFAFYRADAWHIVGGEIYYKCLGNNQYEITVKIYRDCYSSGALFDGAPGATSDLRLHIFDASGGIINVLHAAPVITNIPPDISNPCLVAPPNVCVEEGVYTLTVTLPPKTGGYYIAYQRCCRNQTIVNLQNPQNQGATYVEHVPDPGLASCNSSPYFNNFPPIIICANDPLYFDHSATDPDGDSLVYELCTPYLGANNMNPAPTVLPAPPYTPVAYSFGYSATYPLDASPPLAIDPQSGLLTGTPNMLGQYVVGVCVKEYRNGILIATHRRDFQFNIANCNPTVIADIPAVAPDTMINHCSSYTVTFDNASIGASTYFWDFGDLSVNNDTSNVQFPSYTYPDTGSYYVMLVANPGLVCSDTDYIHVNVYPFLVPDLSYDPACNYDSIQFTDLSTNNHGNIISWKWFFGDGNSSNDINPVHLYGTGTNYNVTLQVMNDKGCKESISKQILLYDVPQADFAFDTVCLNVPIKFEDRCVIGQGNILSWQWDFGVPGAISNDQNPYYTFTDTGTFTVQLIATSDNGCTDTIEHDVIIVEPAAAVISNDTAVCLGLGANLSASGGLFYEWKPANSLSDPNSPNPVATPSVTTTYTVTVSDTCYFDTAVVTVTVLPLPEVHIRPDTSMFRRDSVWVTAWGTGIDYYWSPATGISDPTNPNTFAKPTETMAYYLTTVDHNGCKKTDTIILYVRDVCSKFWMPNAFSPNGDAVNDEYTIVEFADNQLISFQIFNRYGKEIFITDNINEGWDGTYRGQEQELGTYAYRVLMYCDGKEREYTGNLHLLR